MPTTTTTTTKMAASITALLDKLPNEANKIEILEDLKTALGSLPTSVVGDIVANVSFNTLFDCLSTETRVQLELTCDVLQKLLTPLPSDVILTHFQPQLQAGLTNPEVDVRKLCVKQIKRVGEEVPTELTQYEDLLVSVVQLLSDSSTDIAQSAGLILISLGESVECLDVLYQGRCMEALQGVLNANDIVRVRVYDTIIKISQKSLINLQKSAETGIIQQFINELYKDDILLQLNCLELLSDLAYVEHGLAYLDQQGVVTKLETMLQGSMSDPLAGFLIPGLVKFFGSVARLHPKEVLGNNTTFVTILLTNLQSPESPTMLGLCIQTVGFIGQSIEGKMALEKLGTKIDNGVKCLGKALRETQHETKVLVLQTLESLLKLQVADQTSELLKLTQHWFAHLGTRTFDYIMQLVEQPFPDLRSAVLRLIHALALQPWGQRIMNEFPGFKEYLLNRSTEKEKEGKEEKYRIVSTLANSPTVVEVFGNPYLVLLKAYCSQGPFYVRVQAEVAMEGD